MSPQRASVERTVCVKKASMDERKYPPHTEQKGEMAFATYFLLQAVSSESFTYLVYSVWLMRIMVENRLWV
jgi:hypothetical protein